MSKQRVNTRMNLILIVAVCFICILSYSFQPGDEFKVNTYDEGVQWRPKVAMNSKGNFLIVWNNSKYGWLGKLGTYLQRYKKTGKRFGKEIQVFSDYIEGYAEDIVMDKNRNFIIVFHKSIKGYGTDIYAVRYKKTGKRNGVPFKVNENDYGSQENAEIGMDSKGNFVIVWKSAAYDGSKTGIFARRYKKYGKPRGPEFQVNTNYWEKQENPAIAMDAKGNFIIVWESEDYDNSEFGIFGQRFKKDGSPLGIEFMINDYTYKNQINPHVAIDYKGNFVVAWQSEKQDGEGYGIFAKIYNKDGELIVGEFLVNSTVFKDQENPRIAIDRNGDFVIVWQSYYYIKAAKRDFDILGQRYKSDGTTIGYEFLINSYTKNPQENPDIAMDYKGNFVVVWQSENQDDSKWSVYAKFFKK